jgi:nicotinamidase-related amidase
MQKLNRADAVLVVVDVQERLMPVIDGADELSRNVERLIRGAHVLGLPVIVTEQYVKGLGATIEPLRQALEETSGYVAIEKLTFSAYGSAEFLTELRSSRRTQVLLCGIEAHVCVHQTAIDLLAAQHQVHVAVDAIGSRASHNKDIAVRRLSEAGATLTSTEMALFELLVEAGTDEFRAVSKLVK